MEKITDKQIIEELDKKAKRISDNELEIVLKRKKEIEDKFKANGPLGKFFETIKLLFSLIKDYYNRTYKNIPWWSIASIVAALLYVLNPLDLVPDMIPFIGVVDDALVISTCLKMISKDLELYKDWKLMG